MRTTIYGLALLGAGAVAAPALAQTSPAAPDRNPPAATMQQSTDPGTPGTPAPSGARRPTESGQAAVRMDEGTRTAAARRSRAPTASPKARRAAASRRPASAMSAI